MLPTKDTEVHPMVETYRGEGIQVLVEFFRSLQDQGYRSREQVP